MRNVTWEKNTVVQQLSILIGPYKAIQHNKQALSPNIRKQNREGLTKKKKNQVLVTGCKRSFMLSERHF